MTSRFSILKITGFASLIVLGGCISGALPVMRAETAQRIAAPAWMLKRDIPATPFTLRAYERIHARHASADIYIEGDGHSDSAAADPTPTDPLALHLASKDKADNVIYIARPCQYTAAATDNTLCTDNAYVTGDKKFSQKVINAYNAALDDISRRYDIAGFNLIGYDGGGTLATLIAAQRKDILSLRTVAADLTPVKDINGLSALPQYHFLGGQDQITPPADFYSYAQSMPPTPCMQSMLVQEAGHEDGWVNKWPELLKIPVNCYHNGDDQGFTPLAPLPPLAPALKPLPYHEKPAKP